MEKAKFEVGDTVEWVGSNIRMKVAAFNETDGSFICSWKRGPAMHRKRFLAEELAPGTMSAAPPPVRANPSAARAGPRRASSPARGLRSR